MPSIAFEQNGKRKNRAWGSKARVKWVVADASGASGRLMLQKRIKELKMHEKELYPAVEKFLKTRKNSLQNTLELNYR